MKNGLIRDAFLEDLGFSRQKEEWRRTSRGLQRKKKGMNRVFEE